MAVGAGGDPVLGFSLVPLLCLSRAPVVPLLWMGVPALFPAQHYTAAEMHASRAALARWGDSVPRTRPGGKPDVAGGVLRGLGRVLAPRARDPRAPERPRLCGIVSTARAGARIASRGRRTTSVSTSAVVRTRGRVRASDNTTISASTTTSASTSTRGRPRVRTQRTRFPAWAELAHTPAPIGESRRPPLACWRLTGALTCGNAPAGWRGRG